MLCLMAPRSLIHRHTFMAFHIYRFTGQFVGFPFIQSKKETHQTKLDNPKSLTPYEYKHTTTIKWNIT